MIKGFLVVMLLVALLVSCSNSSESDGSSTSVVQKDDAPVSTGKDKDSLYGNWSWTRGTSDGKPITHISAGWVFFDENGSWTIWYDYGYTTISQSGDFQTNNGQLSWGTRGNTVADWYSSDSFEVTQDTLTIFSESGEMVYEKETK